MPIINPDLKLQIEGIIRTMYDVRNKLCKDVSSQLIEYFGNLVYSTVIPRNIRLAEAPSYGMPIAIYDANSKGAKAYFKLAKELLNKNTYVRLNPEDAINDVKTRYNQSIITQILSEQLDVLQNNLDKNEKVDERDGLGSYPFTHGLIAK